MPIADACRVVATSKYSATDERFIIRGLSILESICHHKVDRVVCQVTSNDRLESWRVGRYYWSGEVSNKQ
jgi:hypothetical protein